MWVFKMIYQSKLAVSLALVLSIFFVGMSPETSPAQSAEYNQRLGVSANPFPSSSGVPLSTPAQQVQGQYGSVWADGAAEESLPVQETHKSQSTLPAWALRGYSGHPTEFLEPFGANLFKGNFASTFSDSVNDSYTILPGDRIVVRIWGAKTYDDVLAVDLQGNVFLPEIGPIKVSGLAHCNLQNAIYTKLRSVFPKDVYIYVNLQSAQPVAVYVTGNVNEPGRYAGGSYDSIMSFLDRAGGISNSTGSYRDVRLIRNGKCISTIDLYKFIVQGILPQRRLLNGDIILVGNKRATVAAYGELLEPAFYELSDNTAGRLLLNIAPVRPTVSHVSVQGTRNTKPFNAYMSLCKFQSFCLADGDNVEFVSDTAGNTILTSVKGAIVGDSRFPVKKDTTLKELLQYVQVDASIADVRSIYIQRKSTAAQQKAIIIDSLRRLEQSALTATSSSVDEANIRVREAELIQDFVKRASSIKPTGVVVVSRNGVLADILLEENDAIIIPQRTDVVHISGEVMMQKTIAFDKHMKLNDYLKAAGGLSDRANDDAILIAKVNGQVGLVRDLGIHAGDRILVMPEFDSKNMQFAKDLTQILYQIAIATRVAVGF